MENSFFERLLIEAQELATKTNALNDFMRTQKFVDLDRQNKDLLYKQSRLMNEYLQVLDQRIELHRLTGAKNLRIANVSNRFSPEQMAEWFHNNYEEIAKAEGWQTQENCKVEFKDLPESNRTTMIKVCERWLNGC